MKWIQTKKVPSVKMTSEKFLKLQDIKRLKRHYRYSDDLYSNGTNDLLSWLSKQKLSTCPENRILVDNDIILKDI